MRQILSELITHTSTWTDVPRTTVESVSRYLREGGHLTTGGRGLGAPDMTDRDKLSLLVAVLGCGTARTCAAAFPAILSLPATKVKRFDPKSDPSFLAQPALESALLAMFQDIRSGRVDAWREKVEKKMTTAAAVRAADDPLDLTVTFEVDANHVSIRLKTNLNYSRIHKLGVGPEVEFGTFRVGPTPGYSRRLHELSYERLKGWGVCLTGETPA
jgi:hypothetical protein